MLSSQHGLGKSIDVLKRRPSKLSDIIEENVSYQPIIEEILQEIQFTYSPPAEKKTRKMITEINSTG